MPHSTINLSIVILKYMHTVLALAHKNYNFYLSLHITIKFGALTIKEEEEVRILRIGY